MTERPSDEVLSARLRFLLDQEEGGEDGWWWLSFASSRRFMGVALVSAPGFMHAIHRAKELGINPGGEVAGYPAPPGFDPGDKADRLLSRAELDEAGWV